MSDPKMCCRMPTSPCAGQKLSEALVVKSLTRPCTPAPSTALSWKPSCGKPLREPSFACITSPSCSLKANKLLDSKPCCAGHSHRKRESLRQAVRRRSLRQRAPDGHSRNWSRSLAAATGDDRGSRSHRSETHSDCALLSEAPGNWRDP